MTGEEIKVIITPKGISFEAIGFTGGKCLTELEALEKHMASIGVNMKQSGQIIKPEMYADSVTQDQYSEY
jgi:hypothetical protein